MMRSHLAPLAALALLVSPASATWSITMGDEETGEVAVGTVTCLTGLDLLELVPVVVVGKGAGAVQSVGDFNGIRRPIIFAELMNGTAPADILTILEGVSGHQSRQYGIADTQGGTVTFSGADNGAWAGGVTGSVGSIHYAIQGNVLSGACVIADIEAAIAGTAGDMPAKLMAGMEAARAAGGDGRCSCSGGNPPGCGCPPPSFTKAGHIGGMVVARIGDTDDDVCNTNGCADGDYFMRLNVADQSASGPDPVSRLQTLFNVWRNARTGRPDAVQSVAAFSPPVVPPDGATPTTLEIDLRDWAVDPITVSLTDVTVVHAPGSAGLSTIGAPVDNGDGTVCVPVTAGSAAGVDRFRVTVDDGFRPVVLMPDPALTLAVVGDLDGDGIVGFADLLLLLGTWGPCPAPPAPCPADFDGSGNVGFADLLVLLGGWG